MAQKAKKAAPKKAKKTTATKASSKTEDFRAKSGDELNSQLSNLKKEQFNLRFQRANGQVENTGRIRVLRRRQVLVEFLQPRFLTLVDRLEVRLLLDRLVQRDVQLLGNHLRHAIRHRERNHQHPRHIPQRRPSPARPRRYH